MRYYDSDESITLSGVKITAKDACDFLEQANAPQRCPSCGDDHWDISLTPGNEKIPYLPTTEGTDKESEKIASMFMVSCGKCGLVHLHAMSILFQWKSGKDLNDA